MLNTFPIWLMGPLLLAFAASCTLPLKGAKPPIGARPDSPSGGGSCPTGQCDPDPNGLGIYVAEGHNYCFLHERTPAACLEGFVNTPEGVALRVRSMYQKDQTLQLPLHLRNPTRPAGGEAPPALEAIHGNVGDFFVAIRQGDKALKLRGEAVSGLVFGFRLPVDLDGTGNLEGLLYELALEPVSGNRLAVRYRAAPSTGWLEQCLSPEGRAVASVLLPQRQVDGLNAAVRPHDETLTVACETGAIATCMDWGYQPWTPDTRQTDPDREFVFGACLQAKRAAYFVGQGDLRTYTVSGTEILRRDAHGFGRDSNDDLQELEYLEALWSPRGAECLNLVNRRGRAPIPNGLTLPACAPSPKWSSQARLATGVVQPSRP
ncbi:ADYC domain-containing protein [Corallococcus macrosporus]|uniref:ADYC domain-containing protein n=1 Tax=Myxococcus fulvus (strain ATCC BAA-855 / HW-1) TaxID=483219 RepID=F8C864_MYXFH|nr:ADYC domain-containing protein [Corallococcus macrosporus]AEI68191.1 hypothetical protein LILAB_31550 [Corallococcus macrosporus]